jgi:two-component system response regulator AtoC
MAFDIIIADDDPVVRHILGSVLKAGGHRVEAFASGTALLEGLAKRQEIADLVFLDLQLGDMTGAVLEPRIREVGAGKTRIVVLTANSESETKQLFPTLTPDEFLEKPFTPQVISELLIRLES